MRIYIRHANKEYKNSSTINQDPNITNKGRRESKIVGSKLIEIWGIPDLIITSPYLRCRETTHEMIGEHKVRIIVDSNISEYMGHQKHKNILLTDETQSYSPPMDNTINDLIFRTIDHNEQFSYLNSTKCVVWIITHSFFMHHLRLTLGLSKTPRTKELSGFTVRLTGNGELKSMNLKS
jgi:hypothetical protein